MTVRIVESLGTRTLRDADRTRYWVTMDGGQSWLPVRRWLGYRVATWVLNVVETAGRLRSDRR